MPRLLTAAAACVIALLAASGARADGPAGRWKVPLSQKGQTFTFLVSFTETGGKWVGDFIDSSARLNREPQFASLSVNGDAVRFSLSLGGQEFVSYDGVLAKDGKKITGTLSQFGGPLKLAELYPSKLKKLDDPIALAQEYVGQLDPGPEMFEAGFEVLGQAAAKKIPPEEVRGIADRLAKAAGGYGGRWERTVAIRVASTLADQTGLADVALAQARRAERMLGDDAPVAVQLEVTDTLARVLAKAGKADEAKKYTAAAAKLEARDYAEYTRTALKFPHEEFKGRQGKGDRAVLVEIFTGAECPPCAAVDIACDALMESFKPTDVIVLEYHFHVPAPDPLTSPDGMERVGSYADIIRGAPTILLNGRPGPEGGGPAAAAKEKYAEFRKLVEKALETPAGAKLALAVAPAEKGYSAKATVSDLAAPGDKTSLRFALIEERVRYVGGNGVRYHHHVVRAMPGGARGFPLTKKSQDQTVTFDPADLRGKLNEYLNETAKVEGEFPRPDRPLALAGLKLVAFVQNDATGEVLQAVQVDVDKK